MPVFSVITVTFNAEAALEETLRSVEEQEYGRVEHIIVDGNRFKPYKDIPYTCFVKGDARYASIAAASILAKTFRDDYMKEAAIQYPQYGWMQNCGYPTEAHREAVRRYGLTPLHRKTFRILPDPVLF